MLQDAGTTWTTTPRPRIGHTRWMEKDFQQAGTGLIHQNTEHTTSSTHLVLLLLYMCIFFFINFAFFFQQYYTSNAV